VSSSQQQVTGDHLSHLGGALNSSVSQDDAIKQHTLPSPQVAGHSSFPSFLGSTQSSRPPSPEDSEWWLQNDHFFKMHTSGWDSSKLLPAGDSDEFSTWGVQPSADAADVSPRAPPADSGVSGGAIHELDNDASEREETDTLNNGDNDKSHSGMHGSTGEQNDVSDDDYAIWAELSKADGSEVQAMNASTVDDPFLSRSKTILQDNQNASNSGPSLQNTKRKYKKRNKGGPSDQQPLDDASPVYTADRQNLINKLRSRIHHNGGGAVMNTASLHPADSEGWGAFGQQWAGGAAGHAQGDSQGSRADSLVAAGALEDWGAGTSPQADAGRTPSAGPHVPEAGGNDRLDLDEYFPPEQWGALLSRSSSPT
jgi:hypothetical protein